MEQTTEGKDGIVKSIGFVHCRSEYALLIYYIKIINISLNYYVSKQGPGILVGNAEGPWVWASVFNRPKTFNDKNNKNNNLNKFNIYDNVEVQKIYLIQLWSKKQIFFCGKTCLLNI